MLSTRRAANLRILSFRGLACPFCLAGGLLSHSVEGSTAVATTSAETEFTAAVLATKITKCLQFTMRI
jgi:hypothetical protein